MGVPRFDDQYHCEITGEMNIHPETPFKSFRLYGA